MLFHRTFGRFRGGHLKVFHYFQHASSAPGHAARLVAAPDMRWDGENPWAEVRDALVGDDFVPDIRFLAGLDWTRLDPGESVAPSRPVVNLIQGLRHAAPDQGRHAFLERPAIRLCVSDEVREAIDRTGKVRGPTLTVPVGIDLVHLPPSRPPEERDVDCLVLAVKEPDLGAAVARRVEADGHRVELLIRPVPRASLLATMARSRVAVCLPKAEEGFYLPALECMALEAVVVCPDCVGNRSFCRDGETCFVPRRSEVAIAEAARAALAATDQDVAGMRRAGRREALGRDLAHERARFHAVLADLDRLWGMC